MGKNTLDLYEEVLYTSDSIHRDGKVMRLLRYAGIFFSLFFVSCSGHFENHVVERIVVGGDYAPLQNPLHEEDLMGASTRDLVLIRQTLYAKYGKNFSDPELKRHFERFACYRPVTGETGIQLSDTERSNENLLRNLEEKSGHPVAKQN